MEALDGAATVLALFEEMGADVYSQITRLWWLLAWRGGLLLRLLHDLAIIGRKVRRWSVSSHSFPDHPSQASKVRPRIQVRARMISQSER